MKACTVFVDGKLWKEDDDWIMSDEVPAGAYMVQHGRTWYRHQWGSYCPINLPDVPKELQLTTLLLN